MKDVECEAGALLYPVVVHSPAYFGCIAQRPPLLVNNYALFYFLPCVQMIFSTLRNRHVRVSARSQCTNYEHQ
jgi:hypothetical protein